jgi:hypothetical protein
LEDRHDVVLVAMFQACALSLSPPRRACAGPACAGAEPGGKPEGSPCHPGATGEGKAGRAKDVNPWLMSRKWQPRIGDSATGVTGPVPWKGGRRRAGEKPRSA